MGSGTSVRGNSTATAGAGKRSGEWPTSLPHPGAFLFVPPRIAPLPLTSHRGSGGFVSFGDVAPVTCFRVGLLRLGGP